MLWLNEKQLPLPALENIINESIILDVAGFYRFRIDELKKMSIYQILLLYVQQVREENKIFAFLEMLKPWINPHLYAETRKNSESRRNDFYEEAMDEFITPFLRMTNA